MEDDLLYAAGAVLNLSLGALVAGVRPRRAGNGLLALVLLLNGLYAALMATWPFWQPRLTALHPMAPQAFFGTTAFHLNLASVVPLALLPFVVPWARVSRRAQRGILVAAAALWLASLGESVASVYVAWHGGDVGAIPLAVRPGLILIHGSAIIGTLALLDATVAAQGPLERRVAATLLAGFVLRLASTGITTMSGGALWPPVSMASTTVAWALQVDTVVTALLYAGVWCAALAVPAALLANRLRGGAGTRSAGTDILVCAMLPLGLALGWAGLHFAEYAILRPVILAFAILQFQMLGVEVRRREGLLAAALMAALLAVFLVTQRLLAPRLDAAAIGVALVVTLGTAAALALPLLRILLHPAEGDAPRRLLIYRAALEAARHEGDVERAPTLAALRRELGVSDREHALLVAGPSPGGAALVPGERLLGRYRILRPLGRGATGEVVLARDERLGREVAIKRLAGHVRRDARAVASFEREMRLASTLHHPNVVAVHDVETIDEDAFLIMEHMAGGSLQDRIDRDGALPEDVTRRIARDVLAALAALHARGIIHRDVKPSNVLLDAQGTAKLADFTVARDAVSGDTVGSGSERPAGTWAYMSPEQARGLRATRRSDLYALGATLYAALAGRPPLAPDGDDEHTARTRIAREAPALPLPRVSSEMNAILTRALAKAPAERFADAEAMSAALAG